MLWLLLATPLLVILARWELSSGIGDRLNAAFSRAALKMKSWIPSRRKLLSVTIVVVLLAFLLMDNYVPRLGLVWNIMHGDADFGSLTIPYRGILAIAVVVNGLRWLAPDHARPLKEP